MCLTIPARIIEVTGKKALADFNGDVREISLEFVSAKENDYVLCSAGIATDKITKKRALEMLEIFNADKR